ncbi:L-seryl-tRNA(Sec) kinase isoform X2 [Dendrobates tinctorius]|uniref:L-seryl-tRNA(Sec) kinase isoform X2 n=1 Tax=Dendrobates tinctorius TaxID=92724 RepID=UPI003CC959D8
MLSCFLSPMDLCLRTGYCQREVPLEVRSLPQAAACRNRKPNWGERSCPLLLSLLQVSCFLGRISSLMCGAVLAKEKQVSDACTEEKQVTDACTEEKQVSDACTEEKHISDTCNKKYSLGFCQIFLHCPVDCCLLRNNRRKDRVADSTIILMDSKIEKPNPEKNSWETRSLFLDSSDGIDMDEVSARITNLMKQALENPVLPIEGESTEKERDRDICATNLIHREDQNLRRLISETMQTVKGLVSAKDIKTIAQELQQAKSKALDQLRHSITGQTALTPSTESISGVQSSFREEVDCIVQRYSRRVQVASPVAPSDST